jgi:hypothetical protein
LTVSFPIRAVLRALITRDASPAELPAPGSVPLRRAHESVVILIVVTVGVFWLIAHGYPTGAALAVMGGAGLIATEFVTRSMNVRLRDR